MSCSPGFFPHEHDGEQLLLILPIAHKYCMESIESDLIKQLKNSTTADGYVDLMVASHMIGSDELYQAGLQGLVSSGKLPTVEQAKRIGVEATYAVMTAVHAAEMASLKARHASNAALASATYQENINIVVEAHKVALADVNAKVTVAFANFNNQKCRHCAQLTNWKCLYSNCYQYQA